MQIQQEHINLFKAALRKEDQRLTSQRLAILRDVLGTSDHRECDDIFLSLKEKGYPISRATIYRTLDLLEQAGFVRKMDVGDGRARYENKLAQPHHDHMICLKCGAIIEFIDEEIERRQAAICRQHAFSLLRHNHQLFGICKQCQQDS